MPWKGGSVKITRGSINSGVRDMRTFLQVVEERRTVVDSEGRNETTVTHHEAHGSSTSGTLRVTQKGPFFLTPWGKAVPTYWYFSSVLFILSMCMIFFLRSSLWKIFSSGWSLFHPGFAPWKLVSVPVALSVTFRSLQVLSTPFKLPIANKLSFVCHPKGCECVKQCIELMPVCH